MSPVAGIEKLEKRLRADPTAKVFLPVAEAYRRSGSVERAIEILRAGLEHHPTYPAARVALARALVTMDQTDEARLILTSVVAEVPDNLLARRLLDESGGPVDLPEEPEVASATGAAADDETHENGLRDPGGTSPHDDSPRPDDHAVNESPRPTSPPEHVEPGAGRADDSMTRHAGSSDGLPQTEPAGGGAAGAGDSPGRSPCASSPDLATGLDEPVWAADPELGGQPTAESVPQVEVESWLPDPDVNESMDRSDEAGDDEPSLYSTVRLSREEIEAHLQGAPDSPVPERRSREDKLEERGVGADRELGDRPAFDGHNTVAESPSSPSVPGQQTGPEDAAFTASLAPASPEPASPEPESLEEEEPPTSLETPELADAECSEPSPLLDDPEPFDAETPDGDRFDTRPSDAEPAGQGDTAPQFTAAAEEDEAERAAVEPPSIDGVADKNLNPAVVSLEATDDAPGSTSALTDDTVNAEGRTDPGAGAEVLEACAGIAAEREAASEDPCSTDSPEEPTGGAEVDAGPDGGPLDLLEVADGGDERASLVPHADPHTVGDETASGVSDDCGDEMSTAPDVDPSTGCEAGFTNVTANVDSEACDDADHPMFVAVAEEQASDDRSASGDESSAAGVTADPAFSEGAAGSTLDSSTFVGDATPHLLDGAAPPITATDVPPRRSEVDEYDQALDNTLFPSTDADPDQAESGRLLTLARLYRRQGHLDRAAGVYRDLLGSHPRHDEARRELAELCGEGLSEITMEDIVEELPPSGGVIPRARAESLFDVRRRRIEFLKSWLDHIRLEG